MIYWKNFTSSLASADNFMPSSVIGRRMHWWQALILASGAASLTWILLSIPKSHGSFYLTGPYHVPLLAERFVGGIALIGSVAVAVELFRGSRAAVRGVSLGATSVLFVTSAFLTFLWRLATAAGEGTNFGAGAALLLGPFVVAALLFACVCIERAIGNLQSGFVWWTVLAVSTGPIGVVALVVFL